MQLVTDVDGTISFRGFHGKYRLEAATPEGGTRRYDIHIGPEGQNDWTSLVE